MSNKCVNDRIQTHLGLSESDLKSAAEIVQRCLGATYVLFVKTQNYHWNVTGPQFISLHELFEAQYQEYVAAVDDMAERIRQFGFFVPAHFAAFQSSDLIQEENGFPSAQDMLQHLMQDNIALSSLLRESIVQLESMSADPATIDMLTDRMAVHEKNAWMLRAHLS